MTKFKTVATGVALASAMAFATSALADGGPRRSVKDRAPVAAPFSWTGFYVGVNAGYASGETDVSWVPNPPGFPVSGPAIAAQTAGSYSDKGFTGGGQIGYNLQTGNLVLGVEADIASLRLSDGRAGPLVGFAGTSFAESWSTNWMSTVRARLGLTIGSNFLIYATGGVAFAKVNYSDSITFPTSANAASDSSIQTGWTVGGGGEYAFNRNWTARVEYLYANFGDLSYGSANNSPAFPLSSITHNHGDLTVNVVRAGINYKF